jgi:hypothetical protein
MQPTSPVSKTESLSDSEFPGFACTAGGTANGYHGDEKVRLDRNNSRREAGDTCRPVVGDDELFEHQGLARGEKVAKHVVLEMVRDARPVKRPKIPHSFSSRRLFCTTRWNIFPTSLWPSRRRCGIQN